MVSLVLIGASGRRVAAPAMVSASASSVVETKAGSGVPTPTARLSSQPAAPAA